MTHRRLRADARAPRRPRPHAPSDDVGVSSVVSAVLLVALFTTAMTIWTFTTLPTWVAEREANHLDGAQESFGRLKADLESLAAQDSPGPAATAVDLGPSKVPLLQGTAARGTLSYEDGFSIQGAFTGAVLHLQDGSAIGIPDEPAGGPALTDVHALQAFALRLQSSGVQGGGQEAYVTATATDGTVTVTSSLAHVDDADSVGCSASGLVLRVTSSTTGVTRTAPLLCQVSSDIPEYTLDLLAQPLFTVAMRDLDGGYTLTVTEGAVSATADGTYAAVWVDSDGHDHAVGAGTPSSIAIAEDGGRVVLDPRYQRFPSQTLVYDGGAIIAAQGDQQSMRSGPGFEIDVDNGVGSLRWTIVDLAGSGSRSGSDAVTASVRNDDSTDLLLEATGATFTIDSPYAGAWRQLLDDSILVSASEDAATVGGTGDTATLTLSTGGATGVTSWIIRLHLIDATVTIG